MPRFFLILALMLAITGPAFCEKPSLEALLSIETNESIVDIDRFFIHSSLYLTLQAQRSIATVLELEADQYEVEVGELFLNVGPSGYLNFSFGKLENELTLDEYIDEHKRIFATRSMISRFVDHQGYLSTNIGFKLFKEYSEGTRPISYLFQVAYISSQLEAQFDFGFLYHFAGKDSYLGFFAAYFPFIAHEQGFFGFAVDVPFQNYLANLIWANYEHNLVYGLELTVASNLIDPVGFLHFPETGSDSFIVGGDVHLGRWFDFPGCSWLPALRYTILFPDISEPESYRMELRLGNLLRVQEKLYFHVDSGIGITTLYNQGTLVTQLELLYALSIVVKI